VEPNIAAPQMAPQKPTAINAGTTVQTAGNVVKRAT
jgi:hypothetical protein